MKKSKYIITAILLSLILCNQVHAACSQEQIKEFNKVAGKYKVTYEYDEKTEIYTVTFHNPNPALYDYQIRDLTGKATCRSSGTNIICTGKNLDTQLEYSVIGMTTSCNQELKSGTFEVEKEEDNQNTYNKFSESELCEGIEEFVLCQKDYNKELTEEEFISRVESYKKQLEESKNKPNQQEQNNNDNKQKKDILADIINYLKNHITETIIVIVFIIIFTISTILTVKSIRKSRRLE